MKMNLMCPNWGMATLAGISHREGKTLCLDADIRKGGPRRPFAGRGCGLESCAWTCFPTRSALRRAGAMPPAVGLSEGHRSGLASRPGPD